MHRRGQNRGGKIPATDFGLRKPLTPTGEGAKSGRGKLWATDFGLGKPLKHLSHFEDPSNASFVKGNTSMSDDNVIENLDPVGMLFLSDLTCQECSTYTTTNQQEFDFPESRTGHGRERFSPSRNTRWREVTRCAGQEIALLSRVLGKTRQMFAPHRVRGEQESTRSRTSQSTRKDQTTDLHSSKCTRNTDSHAAQSPRTQTCSRQSLPSGDGAIHQDHGAQHKRMTYE